MAGKVAIGLALHRPCITDSLTHPSKTGLPKKVWENLIGTRDKKGSDDSDCISEWGQC